jgi:CHAT domain-containing protein/tetratricopeptide (TPR) repeat protein
MRTSLILLFLLLAPSRILAGDVPDEAAARQLVGPARAGALARLARGYNEKRQWDRALALYDEALAIDRVAGDDQPLAAHLSGSADVLVNLGRLRDAIARFDESIALDRKSGRDLAAATSLNKLGAVYEKHGYSQKALECYFDASKLARSDDALYAVIVSNVANVFGSLGRYREALALYQQSLALEKKLGHQGKIAARMTSVASAHRALKEADKAIPILEEALEIGKRAGDDGAVARTLNELGLAYTDLQQPDKARERFEAALRVALAIGDDGMAAAIRANLGGSDDDAAVAELKQSVVTLRKAGDARQLVAATERLAALYLQRRDYPRAIYRYAQAIELTEALRRQAPLPLRRDYLQQELHNYQFLAAAHLFARNPKDAFAVIETSRAKELAERLSGTERVAPPSLAELQAALPEDAALVSFFNVAQKAVAHLVITRDAIRGELTQTDGLCAAALRGDWKSEAQLVIERQRGHRGSDLENVVAYYRALLQAPAPVGQRGVTVVGRPPEPEVDPALKDAPERARRLGRMLYVLLFTPIEAELQGKRRLIIIPDGALGFVPFESLRDGDGKYLAERYEISYAQSATVLGLLAKRQPAPGRKPMLVLGGAVYESTHDATAPLKTEEEVDMLGRRYEQGLAARGSGSSRPDYASLGIQSWQYLPGTLSEARQISATVHGAEVLSGAQVAEDKLKALSASGALGRYRVLHFATHGLVVPSVPQLSALVLSQFQRERGGEDGYLRMEEIEQLKLDADFVALSACETGLGKIYGGEGVVGLTQSFLIAGASGLSVSLWAVADESTAKFMTGLYEREEAQHHGYAAAIADMKRRFIAGEFGEAYRAPYYWAPFVYYGK